MPYPSKPILKSSDSEFLLFIHPVIKERAKVISGYRWDSIRKCWVYPKTQRVYKALISEFGDELHIVGKVKPTPALDVPLKSPSDTQNEALQEEINRLREQIKKFSQPDKDAIKQEKTLRDLISSREKELSEFRQELLNAEKELHKTKRELLKANTEIQTLRLSHKSRKSNTSLENILKEVALDATGNDSNFSSLLTRIKLDESLPLIIQRETENELRKLLGIPREDKSLNMFNLIQQASDTEILPRDAIDLAHTIRKQRNIVAHRDTYEKTYQARIILCLFAAALLWPELPE